VKHFVVGWDSSTELPLSGQLHLKKPENEISPKQGDLIYVMSIYVGSPKILARLICSDSVVDEHHQRVSLSSNHPDSAVFFRKAMRASSCPQEFIVPEERSIEECPPALHKWLTLAIGNNSFARLSAPINWASTVLAIKQEVRRVGQRPDTRSDVQVATDFLRGLYPTSELPGPSPVFLNAARLALDESSPETLENSNEAGSLIHISKNRKRHSLDDLAIGSSSTESETYSAHPPDSRRHQNILKTLRDQLISIGLEPLHDGYIDCIVEFNKFDVFFEVKSASSPASFAHQLRQGVGQLLYYLWQSRSQTKPASGWVVIEQRDVDFDYLSYVNSTGLSVLTTNELQSLSLSDLTNAKFPTLASTKK